MSPKIRVAILASTQGVYGGIEVTAVAQAEYLAAQSDMDVTLAFKLVKGYSIQHGLKAIIAESGIHAVHTAGVNATLLRLLHSADVIHLHNPMVDLLVLALMLGKPTVVTIHNWKRSSWRHRLAALLLGNVTWRTYNSSFVRSTWSDHAPAASSMIPTVSRLPDQRPLDPEARRGFIFVGRWVPNKGLDLLLEAYAQAAIDRSKWPLRLIGDGPLRDLVDTYRARDEGDGLEVLGFVSDAAKFAAIAGSKWLVAPAHTREDMGLTPIEARSLGVPSIVTMDGGLPEAAGAAALLAIPGDVISLRAQLEHAAAMSEAEYQRRSTLATASLPTYLKPRGIYAEAYRQIVNNGTVPTPNRA